jgi:hypothetical protein
LILSPVYAKKVDEKDVLKVIEKALKKENKQSEKLEKLIPMGLENDTLIYIAKFQDEGFLIISGDNAAPPVLGKTFRGEFDPEKMPGGLLYLMERYKVEISAMRKKGKEPTDEIRRKWDEYLQASSSSAILKSNSAIQSVSPLIGTEWNQDGNFAMYCPSGCLAGCTAVAMAQILYKWKYDVDQTGSNTHDGQTADFGNEYYYWINMSNYYASSYNAKLIYHAGVSCNTNYSTSGSQSLPGNAADGFKNYWGMSSNTDVKWRIWYSTSTWRSMLLDELDNGRPILYSGGNISFDGHSWVIEGYNSADEFYCNWGWGGDYNNYYSLGDFDPDDYYDELGPYNQIESAIVDIYPATTVCSSISGPSTLTSSLAEYTIDNIADYVNATWQCSSNIASYYGTSHMIVLHATGAGAGWIQASYNINGTTVTSPKKYVTCYP